MTCLQTKLKDSNQVRASEIMACWFGINFTITLPARKVCQWSVGNIRWCCICYFLVSMAPPMPVYFLFILDIAYFYVFLEIFKINIT